VQEFQFLPKTVSTSLGLPPKALTCLDPTTLPTASRHRADCANMEAPPNICHAAPPDKLIWRLQTPSLDLRSCQMRTFCQTDLTLCLPYAYHSGAGNTAISMKPTVMTSKYLPYHTSSRLGSCVKLSFRMIATRRSPEAYSIPSHGIPDESQSPGTSSFWSKPCDYPE
jgi:hypothetical protein